MAINWNCPAADGKWREIYMKKWKSSKGLKIFMAVVSVVSLTAMLISAAAVLFMADNGLYSKPRKTVLQDAYERYSYIYSVMAVANRDSDSMKEELGKTNFRYGIIKAKDINEVDISDPENYLYYNFETMPEQNSLEEETAGINSFETGVGTQYSWDCRIFGHASVWYDDYCETVTSHEAKITGVYYNTIDGIFYYSTEDGFYRIDTVSLPLSTNGEFLTFEYDSGQKAYYNVNQSVCLVQDYYVTFNMFDKTTMPWETWNEIYLNDNLYTHTDIRFVTDEYTYMGEMLGKPIIEEYYSYEGGDYITVHPSDTGENGSETSEREMYHVIYQVNEPLQATGLRYYGELFDGDLYEQITALLNYCYMWQYAAIAVLIVSLVLWAVSTVLLLIMAGHKGNYETIELPAGERKEYPPEEEEETEKEISPEEVYQRDVEESESRKQPMRKERRWVDKIETGVWQKILFDLETIAVFVAEGFVIIILEQAFRYATRLSFALAALTCMAGYIIGLIWLTDFVIRLKVGKWWRGTLIYRILSWCGGKIGKVLKKGVRFFRENFSLLGKAIFILLGLCIFEFIVIVVTGFTVEVELPIWLMYRAATVVLVLVGLVQANELKTAAEKMAAGNMQEKVKTEKMFWEFKKHGETLNSISDGLNLAVEKRMQSEHFRTELITNVSHDIKTPLTSIINYVDLLQKENIEGENAKQYLEVLSRQSARLKKLTEDLVEASKASTGSMPVNMEKLELGVFLTQTLGEFEEKLEEAGLRIVMHKPEKEIMVSADGRHLWRVVENLIQNICKYAQPSTRVYIDLEEEEKEAVISFKNISGYELNISGEELMERFVRGDASRHTEGSGLGLSIAGSLMELMNGRLEIVVDGDLFKVILHFPRES